MFKNSPHGNYELCIMNYELTQYYELCIMNYELFFAFLKRWTLPISMITGVIAYFVYVSIPWLDATHQFAADAVSVIQPALIFLMLLMAFCKVEPSALRPHRWQFLLLAIQAGAFALMAVPLILFPSMPCRPIVESAMICMICPTATAASVVTSRLGGDAGTVVSYTVVINLVGAVLIPLVVSLLPDRAAGMDFLTSFTAIISRVFPLLIMPLFLAFAFRRFMPRLHAWLVRYSATSFYLWAVALSLAIVVTTKAIVHSHESLWQYVGIALASAAACAVQFALGRLIGKKNRQPIAGAQSLGQKNTAFAIWMAYTFMNPITALAGGFYSVWHNVVNSYQLYQYEKRKKDMNTMTDPINI